MEVGIVAKRGSARAIEVASEIVSVLREADCTVWADEAMVEELGTRAVGSDALGKADLIVSIGGDGTFLHATHHAGSTPILGVNLGEVGFLNPVPPDDAERAVREAVEEARSEGGFSARTADRLATGGPDWTLPPALNEVVVTGVQRGPSGGVDLTIAVDDVQYTETAADGVIVSTPTGSTAYNLSEGGPLVHPEVSGMVITEMAAADPMPPLVVGPDSRVTIHVSGGETAIVAADGGHRHRLSLPGEVTVQVADEPIHIAGPPSDFFTALEKID